MRVLVVALIAAVLGAAGLGLVASAGGEATPRRVVADGVPLYEVHPAGLKPGERRPGVVVAHGYAGSAKLMMPFGDTLAGRGYVVVLLDFAGHGANPKARTGSADLQRELDAAMAHLRSLRDVDNARVSLVGHSMGASAVTEYAAAHPEVVATVAISLPSVPEGHPKNLLMLVGQAEFPGFKATATEAAARIADSRAVTIPGVEHISILYAPRTHQETIDWLDQRFGGPVTQEAIPSPLRRPAGAGLLFAGLLVGLYPLARLLFRGRATIERFRWVLLVPVAGAAIVAALVAAVLPTSWFPLDSGDYAVAFTFLFGGLLLLVQRGRPGPWGRVPAAVALVAYAAVTIVVPLQLGFTNMWPAGARWWILPVVWAGFALLSYAAERLSRGSMLGILAVAAATVVALTAAAVLGLTNGFLLLVVPLLAVLLVLQAGWSTLLNRLAAPAWAIALAGSLLVAWPIAATLPITA
ncbi:alpha/beta hydrolase [Paractinoplanes atraurantiacus]|uniref:alpha/beta hydrolase n=1 Tax=Paractinoplanes atraurantiacus TaxID=1036182 RepID=UPI001FE75AB4|nr:alpha/beta fold hydrolase [Actinoplanes atraurantiacus]